MIALGSSGDTDALIEWLKRLFGRSDPTEDLISAYVDSTDEAEPERIEEMLSGSGVDVDDARSVRETSQLLRSLNTVEAPRSYALTPDALAERGYSDREIDEVLDPRTSRGRLRLRSAAVYVPLAIAAVALTGVALLTIGDLTDYVIDRSDPVETIVMERQVQLASDTGDPTTEPLGEVVVEKEVVVEREVEVAGETVVQTVVVEKEVFVETEVLVTVVVEKEVQVAGETVVQTVEVVVEKEVPVTVVVEKVVEVEKVIEKEIVKEVEVEVVVEVEKEVAVKAVPVPTATPATIAKAAAHEGREEIEETVEPPKESPCAIIPTPESKPTKSPEEATTPEPTPTMLPIPTCTPTPTPTATFTPTPSPSPTP